MGVAFCPTARRDIVIQLFQNNFTVDESVSNTGAGLFVFIHVTGRVTVPIDLQFTALGGTALGTPKDASLSVAAME